VLITINLVLIIQKSKKHHLENISICLIFSSKRKESTDEIIPCEYCGGPVSIHDWEWHSVIK
jgi:hypothetical protein